MMICWKEAARSAPEGCGSFMAKEVQQLVSEIFYQAGKMNQKEKGGKKSFLRISEREPWTSETTKRNECGKSAVSTEKLLIIFRFATFYSKTTITRISSFAVPNRTCLLVRSRFFKAEFPFVSSSWWRNNLTNFSRLVCAAA